MNTGRRQLFGCRLRLSVSPCLRRSVKSVRLACGIAYAVYLSALAYGGLINSWGSLRLAPLSPFFTNLAYLSLRNSGLQLTPGRRWVTSSTNNSSRLSKNTSAEKTADGMRGGPSTANRKGREPCQGARSLLRPSFFGHVDDDFATVLWSAHRAKRGHISRVPIRAFSAQVRSDFIEPGRTVCRTA
jgi:hypothetical protein